MHAYFYFLAMNVKYCLTINPVMWFRFMGRILIFYQHGMSINRLSIAPGNQTDFPLRRESLSIVQYLIKSRSNYKKIKLYDYYFRSEKKVTLKTRNYSGF